MSELESYFNSYAKVAPAWSDWIEDCNSRGVVALSGFSPKDFESRQDDEGNNLLAEVTKDNFPKVYNALKDECEFRDITMPACYMDKSKTQRGGEAFSGLYSINIEHDLYDLCSQEELRWIVAHEIKHLYHAGWDNDKEYKKNELDADRAAVESVGYDTAKSFMHKLSSLKIAQKTGLSAKFISKVVPEAITTGFPVSIDGSKTDLKKLHIVLDPRYPSFSGRMKYMKEHLDTLEMEG